MSGRAWTFVFYALFFAGAARLAYADRSWWGRFVGVLLLLWWALLVVLAVQPSAKGGAP